MLILHLSDLHFGTHSRFKGEDLAKLGKAFFKDLTAARGSFAKGSRIDFVAVTGDIAESGKPTEFKDGERFLAALAGELGLDRRRFVFVPGTARCRVVGGRDEARRPALGVAQLLLVSDACAVLPTPAVPS